MLVIRQQILKKIQDRYKRNCEQYEQNCLPFHPKQLKPHHHYNRQNLLWMPLLQHILFPHTFKCDIVGRYKFTYIVTKMMMFDLNLNFEAVTNLLVLFRDIKMLMVDIHIGKQNPITITKEKIGISSLPSRMYDFIMAIKEVSRSVNNDNTTKKIIENITGEIQKYMKKNTGEIQKYTENITSEIQKYTETNNLQFDNIVKSSVSFILTYIRTSYTHRTAGMYSWRSKYDYPDLIYRIVTMCNVIEPALQRDPFRLQYKYDTPNSYMIRDNTLIINDYVYIFEYGKFIKKVPYGACCHSHGIKYHDPEWQEKCCHLQCAGCGILYFDQGVVEQQKIVISQKNQWRIIEPPLDSMPRHKTPANNTSGYILCNFCDGHIYYTRYLYYHYESDFNMHMDYAYDYYKHEYDSDSSDDYGINYESREKISAKVQIMEKTTDELVKDEIVYIRRKCT